MSTNKGVITTEYRPRVAQIILVAAALLIPGCGTIAGTATTVPSSEHETFTINGTMTAGALFTVPLSATTCRSRANSFEENARVLVKSEFDVVVGTGFMSEGLTQQNGDCLFRFAVEVERGPKFYSIYLGTQDTPATMTAQHAEAGIELSAG